MKRIEKLGLCMLLLGIAFIAMGPACPMGKDTDENYYTTNITSGSSALVTPTPWFMVGGGDDYTIAIRDDGTLWSCGNSSQGVTGGGAQYFLTRIGSDTNWQAIACGRWHVLALRTDGTVWAWGWNSTGQLGLGDTTQRYAPVQVGTDTDWVEVVAGRSHSLARKSDGTLYAWGENSDGQLGLGHTTSPISAPVQAGTDSNWTAIAAGYEHSLARKSNGTLYAWGENTYGQLGLGYTSTPISVTTQVGTDSNWTAIAGGFQHTLAISTTGTTSQLWAWGRNNNGQIGNNAIAKSTIPLQVNIANVITMATGSYNRHSLAILSGNTARAWGWNGTGQLGNGTNISTYNLVTPSGLTNLRDVANGVNHSIALKTDGTVWAWGDNLYGQLGDDTQIQRRMPVQVNWVATATQVSAGASYSLALLSDGTIASWGYNANGQLGDDTQIQRLMPVQVNWVTTATQVSAGNLHSLALLSNGTIASWGDNDNGQLGDDTITQRLTPVQVNWVATATQVSAGNFHSLALLSDGTVVAWGYNAYGQIGDGTSGDNRLTPVQVNWVTTATQVCAGYAHSLALLDDTVVAWGQNTYGQLGDGTTDNRLAPVQVHGLTNVIAIASGYRHSLALKADGTVWAWGDNTEGEIGQVSFTQELTPVMVSTAATNWSKIAVGNAASVSLARKSDGTVWAWGENSWGQCGQGDFETPVTTPSRVGFSTNWVSIGGGYDTSYAILSDGTLWGWGYGLNWELATGDFNIKYNVATPIRLRIWE